MSPLRRRWYRDGSLRFLRHSWYGKCSSSGTSLVALLCTLDQPLVSTVEWPPDQISVLEMGSYHRLIQKTKRNSDHINAVEWLFHKRQYLVSLCSCRGRLLPELQRRKYFYTQVLPSGNCLHPLGHLPQCRKSTHQSFQWVVSYRRA